MATRRDFVAIASAFNASYADADDDISLGIDVALANVTEHLRQVNANFNANLFLQAASKNRKNGTPGIN